MKSTAEFYEEQAAKYLIMYDDMKNAVRMIVSGLEAGDINFEEAVEKLKALTESVTTKERESWFT